MEVPRTLRVWFAAHTALCAIVGAALLAAPGLVLRRLGWTSLDATTARVAGIVFLAMSARSFRARSGGLEICRPSLRVHALWSFGGAFAFFAFIGAGAPPAAWAFLSGFIVFAGVWTHHLIRFRQLDHVARLDDSPADEGDAEPLDES
jgi:hypothetical protein